MYSRLPTVDEVPLPAQGSRSPSPIIVGQPHEQLSLEPDHLSSTRSHSAHSKNSSKFLLGGVIGGIFLSASIAGVYKVLSHNESNSECIPKSPSIPTTPLLSPPNHITSDLGIFGASPDIIDSTNHAELYLNKSINARDLFERILGYGSPVPVSYYSGENSFENRGSIVWNDKKIGESKDQEYNATSVSCGAYSPALTLAHEAEHAEWDRSNPLGSFILYSLDGYPFYDNLEEARTIRATNRIAADLNESIRSTHHGRENAQASNVTDSHSGVCPGGELASEQNDTQLNFGGGPRGKYQHLFSGSTASAKIWAALAPHAAFIPDQLTAKLHDLLNERDQVFMRLNAAVSNEKFSDIDFKDILENHIDKATDIATQFSGIGQESAKAETRLLYEK